MLFYDSFCIYPCKCYVQFREKIKLSVSLCTFDIFFVSETWQRSLNKYDIEGFESVCIPRHESVNNTSTRCHG